MDGAGHAPSGLWTATTRLLQTADVPAATAWRAAAAGLAGDAKRWALAVLAAGGGMKGRTAFAKAVRDLHYAGLVASKRGRFSAVTTRRVTLFTQRTTAAAWPPTPTTPWVPATSDPFGPTTFEARPSSFCSRRTWTRFSLRDLADSCFTSFVGPLPANLSLPESVLTNFDAFSPYLRGCFFFAEAPRRAMPATPLPSHVLVEFLVVGRQVLLVRRHGLFELMYTISFSVKWGPSRFLQYLCPMTAFRMLCCSSKAGYKSNLCFSCSVPGIP